MTIGRVLIASAILALASPVVPALAHDDGYSYRSNQHRRDHATHRSFHREVNEIHQNAHEEGFNSRAEHRAYHQGLRRLHGDFHAEHPNTRHDHYDWRRRFWSTWR